ncbi:MAG: arylsulfatase, partial [Phycisphaerae bacterium]
IDLMPTCLDLAGATYPREFHGRELTPPAGRSLVPVFRGGRWPEPRTLYWEHEGNRAIRKGDWKLVGEFRGPWELYDMRADRTETKDLAAGEPERVKALAAEWQTWADKVGVIPWEKLPGGNYRPSSTYRKKSEPVAR